MKNASTGNTRSSTRTTIDDWENAVIKKNSVEIGRVKGVRSKHSTSTQKP